MTAFRNRLLGLVAGTLALSCFSSMAYAQGPEPVLSFAGSTFQFLAADAISVFTLDQSLILNSIGFVYDSSIVDSSYSFVYTLDGFATIQTLTVAETRLDSTGLLRYYDLPNPTTYAKGTIIYLATVNPLEGTYVRSGFTPYAVGVSHSNAAGSTFAAGNLRVTALGGSVAPEPGTFALALTGGAALLGICMRRRRNAA